MMMLAGANEKISLAPFFYPLARVAIGLSPSSRNILEHMNRNTFLEIKQFPFPHYHSDLSPAAVRPQKMPFTALPIFSASPSSFPSRSFFGSPISFSSCPFRSLATPSIAFLA